ncbi:hypothetical protein [Haematobacter genomosp. 1]|uniref:DUF4148 domain-containing protein n=1 Tax=Haematobacter genomosp. 1 TaxID=366618 RepID=A0A212ACZ9_9RHOB|nr:hypothetical protein [Haematobacter genomosp. 1]OWJ78901.1 hypothetical protein CDV49_07315 [Haematobacter genomosp. 1]
MLAKTIMTVALLGLAAPVAAQSVNPGKAQMAAELGVNPSDFTLIELIQLDTAKRNHDSQLWNRIMDREAGVTRNANTPTALMVPGYADTRH